MWSTQNLDLDLTEDNGSVLVLPLHYLAYIREKPSFVLYLLFLFSVGSVHVDYPCITAS